MKKVRNVNVPVLNLAQFVKIYGGVTRADVESHIHASLRSMPTTKTYKRSFDAELKRLQSLADDTTRRYHQALDSGKILRPLKPTMEEIAAGDPSKECTQAAKRVLAKLAARKSNKVSTNGY